MKRTPALAAAALALAGCVSANHAKQDKAAVESRLQQYASLQLAMDSKGIAAMFSPDGELVNPSQPPVRGRAAIERFIASYSDFHVLSNSEDASNTLVDGDTAEQIGTYRQRVLSPGGKVFDVSGRFEIEWVRPAPTGPWLLQQVATFPTK